MTKEFASVITHSKYKRQVSYKQTNRPLSSVLIITVLCDGAFVLVKSMLNLSRNVGLFKDRKHTKAAENKTKSKGYTKNTSKGFES